MKLRNLLDLRGQARGIKIARAMMNASFKASANPCAKCGRKPVLERGDEWLCTRCGAYYLTKQTHEALVAPYDKRNELGP